MNRSESPTWTCVACKHWGGRKVGVEHFEGICWKIRKKTVFAAPACEQFEPTTESGKNADCRTVLEIPGTLAVEPEPERS